MNHNPQFESIVLADLNRMGLILILFNTASKRRELTTYFSVYRLMARKRKVRNKRALSL
jgi:hypothetical protein